jgi:hypothetical protein
LEVEATNDLLSENSIEYMYIEKYSRLETEILFKEGLDGRTFGRLVEREQ